MLTLSGTLDSRNVHKAQMILGRAGRAYRRVYVAQTKHEPRDEKNLAVNPMGKVPAVLRESGRVETESGGIPYYFAQDTPLWPQGIDARTEVLRWMFFEQYTHEPSLAVMRYLRCFIDHPSRHAARVAELEPEARHALGVMESRLSDNAWLAAGMCTIADYALYPLTRIDDWHAVAKVHGEVFSGIRPASTIVRVTGFVDPEWLVETETETEVDVVVTGVLEGGDSE